MIQLFSRLSKDTIGQFNWNPYIPYVMNGRAQLLSKSWMPDLFNCFQIFSNLLRGFGLPFSTKESILLGIENLESVNSVSNLSQVFMYSTQDINAMACWIVNMIGSGPDDQSSDDQSSRNLCMNHIKRLFELLRSFFYPSNTGTWSVSR